MPYQAKAPIAVLTSLLLVSCTTEQTTTERVQETNYAGFYNRITGKLSDGTVFSGVAWFDRKTPTGKFCLQAGDLVCSGDYSTGPNLITSGPMSCNKSTTGTFETTRVPRGRFIVPESATGTLSDGRTAKAVFGSPLKGRGTTICFR